YALEYELVDRNYSRQFRLTEDVMTESQITRNSHIAFTEEEIDTLWQNINIPYVDMILIQCYSGWRPQELCSIKIEDVDLKNWTIKGGMKTKAGKGRVVPVHTKIRDLVKKRYDEAVKIKSKSLFNAKKTDHSDYKEVDYGKYQYAFAQVISLLNLNANHRPHDGRTHFVTIAKKYNVDEYAIKYLVGHSIADFTEKVYTKREFQWLKQEIEKIK
ncbi:MAG: site-specific integrase, partial [Oscillospiraceae bacterium]|nr:site-specific integrase [Oscillospiraceae bacterium]